MKTPEGEKTETYLRSRERGERERVVAGKEKTKAFLGGGVGNSKPGRNSGSTVLIKVEDER